MGRYMIQASYTKEAVAALIQKPEDRELVVQPLIEQLGGRLLEFYFCLGEYDVVCIADLPSQTAALALDMAIVAPGHISKIRTTALLSGDQSVMAMKEAAVVSLRAPGM